MGKNKAFRIIRAVSEGLPKILVSRTKVIRVFGHELIEQGITKDSSDKDIHPKYEYKRKSKVDEPVNHYDEMKAIYLKSGMVGVERYVTQVNAIAARHEKKIPHVVNGADIKDNPDMQEVGINEGDLVELPVNI